MSFISMRYIFLINCNSFHITTKGHFPSVPLSSPGFWHCLCPFSQKEVEFGERIEEGFYNKHEKSHVSLLLGVNLATWPDLTVDETGIYRYTVHLWSK